MFRFILPLLLILLFASTAEASLTVTARGTGGNNSSSTSITVTPGSNLAAGSLAVLVITLDNAGNNVTICASSMTDSVGNSWTERQNNLYDPGAASAGVEIAIYTAHLIVGFTTADNVVISFGGTSVTAKVWALWEVAPGAGKIAVYVTGAVGAGATTGTPTITTGTITNTNAVIAGGGAESANTWVRDTDTTNGNWTDPHQATAAGTGNSGMSITSQVKVVTATATQTYNPTLTSVDTILAWIEVAETTPGGFMRSIPGG